MARREKHQPTNVISQHMKSLLNSSCSKTPLLIVLFVFSCGGLMIAQPGGNDSLFIGMVRSGTLDHGIGLAEGYLLVYSATDEFNDGDLVFNAHSSYLIYTSDGKLFKIVENHVSRSDEIPERELAGRVLHRRSPISKQRIRPRSRGDQAESADAPRPGFERQRITQGIA